MAKSDEKNGKGPGGGGGGGGGPPKKDTLTVIVNGTPTEVKYNDNQPLHALIGKALEQSDTDVGDIEGWYFNDAAGNELDLKQKIGEFKFPEGVKLFLNKRAGPLG
jgi:hypothetical protein